MAQLMSEILSEWREAERLLDQLPPFSPRHETVQLIVSELRLTYARLADCDDLTQTEIESYRHVLAEAQALMEGCQFAA